MPTNPPVSTATATPSISDADVQSSQDGGTQTQESDTSPSSTQSGSDEGSVGDTVQDGRETKEPRPADLELLIRSLELQYGSLLFRMNNLEWQLGNKEPPEPPEGSAGEDPSRAAIQPTLNPLYWEEFQEVPSEKNLYPIEVLVGEPVPVVGVRKHSQKHTRMHRVSKDDDVTEQSKDFHRTKKGDNDALHELHRIKGHSLPERIRLPIFTSQYLMKQILGPQSTIPHGYSRHGITMLRPYKPLLTSDKRVRSRLLELRHLIDTYEDLHRSKADASNEESDSSTDPESGCPLSFDAVNEILDDCEMTCCSHCTQALRDEVQTTKMARDILQCLLDFVDQFLVPVHESFRKRDHSRMSVSFSHLWHMFKAGDHLLMNQSIDPKHDHPWHSTLWRVLQVRGGRAQICRRYLHPPPLPPGPNGQSPPMVISPVNGVVPFVIDAYYIDFDGRRLIPVRRRFTIQPYEGERDIRKLDVYPVEYASDWQASMKSLAARGRKFVDSIYTSAVTHVEYRGVDLKTKDELDEQMIVDMEYYWRHEETQHLPYYFAPEALDTCETAHYCTPNDWEQGYCGRNTDVIVSDNYVEEEYMDEHVEGRGHVLQFTTRFENKKNFEEDDLAICSHRLFGWCLRSRKWAAVLVDNIVKVHRGREDIIFDQLVLPSETKRIIQAQVQEHFRKKGSRANDHERDLDIVSGKGQGLMILLHGAPGVGKTATAECVADLVQRPLYPLTCGDLGSNAKEIEDSLSFHLYSASRWDCVMLLDEADVFMAKRTRDDYGRNATVSVFLRMLEYYKGILFLTTNRIGTFDEAFKSRIHLSLFYPNFDEQDTVDVWKVFIRRTKKANGSRPNFHIDSKSIKSFAREHYNATPEGARWNGRQIRNAFHTALAMAEYEARSKQKGFDPTDPDGYSKDSDVKVELGRSQFEVVARTVELFDEYMKDTLGNTYEEKMEHEKIRKTKFRSREKKKGKKSKSKRYDSDSSSSKSSVEDRRKSKKKESHAKKKNDSSDSDSDSD